MIYRFDQFELDLDKAELRHDGLVRHLEPQVYALLVLLIQNQDRMVSKDEIVEKIWDGRFVSDSAVSSRIKSLRQALGDSGAQQQFIRTLHGRGFRFVAQAQIERTTVLLTDQSDEAGKDQPLQGDGRPSIAILPFRVLGEPGAYMTIGEALPHELIAELARMRWLYVTARGSSFRFGQDCEDIDMVARTLAVRYCLTGVIEFSGPAIAITVELVDSRQQRLVWAERFHGSIDDIHAIRETIRTCIVAALEIAIPQHEAKVAGLSVTENLDSWSAYHLGLQHMYRFNRQDNVTAEALFEKAIAQDPGFARAHAGLSFVHFQTAFLGHSDDRGLAVGLARRFAERGFELDATDPFVNFTMGRSYWLEGDLDTSLAWLERATQISPHYAQGIYARAWTEALSGLGSTAREHVDLAMRLSPLDPLHYAMLGTRSLSHMSDNEVAEAILWGERAARAPGAHVLIAMIALVAHALAGNELQARNWAANVRSRNPKLSHADFFQSFPMKSPDLKKQVSRALESFGF